MKKLISFITIVFVLTFLFTYVHAITVAWDDYTDPIATDLRIYKSLDQSNWTILVDNIPTDKVASDLPDHPTDNQRVYYMMRAFNTNATDPANEESANSNTISYFWTTGGGGYSGPAGLDGIRFLDCDAILLDVNHPDYDLCMDRHIPIQVLLP